MSGEQRRGDGADTEDDGARGGPGVVSDTDDDSAGGLGGPAGDTSDATGVPDDEKGGEDSGDWRYTLEDLGENEANDSAGDDDEGEGVAGVFGPSEGIEPGKIDRESVVFVLLGAIVAGVGLYLMVAP